MRISILTSFLLLFLACNSGKEIKALKQQNDSLRVQVDSLKSFYISVKYAKQIKAKHDSIRKIKLAFWKKQTTLMTVNLSADKANLNHAHLHSRQRTPAQQKRAIKLAARQLEMDRIRAAQIRDSLNKYRN